MEFHRDRLCGHILGRSNPCRVDDIGRRHLTRHCRTLCEFLTHARGHCEVCTNRQKPHRAPITDRSIVSAILEHEHEHFP
jgi:hypothetical protein